MSVDRFYESIERKMKGGFFSVLVLYMIRSSEEPVHGYRITQRMQEMTRGAIAIKAGTVYPILRNLEDKGLVSHAPEKSERGPRRKVYSLTVDGKEAVRRFDGLVNEFFRAVWTIRSEPGLPA